MFFFDSNTQLITNDFKKVFRLKCFDDGFYDAFQKHVLSSPNVSKRDLVKIHVNRMELYGSLDLFLTYSVDNLGTLFRTEKYQLVGHLICRDKGKVYEFNIDGISFENIKKANIEQRKDGSFLVKEADFIIDSENWTANLCECDYE